MSTYTGRTVIAGTATGPVLAADLALSFMGGVDPATGVVIDTHHPLRGSRVADTILVLPSGRGSCSGSGVLFELLLNGHAPAALVFGHDEPILTLAVILAEELFGLSIPVLILERADFVALSREPTASVVAATVPPGSVVLSEHDQQLLAGELGEAARLAIRVIIRAAQLEGATELIDIERGHIDGVFYQGPASVRFAERLVELGGRVAVPASMNAICVDRRRWRSQGVPVELGEPSERLADAYRNLGVAPTYTCAPYQLDEPPHFGQQIAWAESNAVVYANSVLGARTIKYPDYLDILVALTGRAPNAGPHTDAGRLARIRLHVDVPLDTIDDAFYPTLGYHVGSIATNAIPVLTGLEGARPSLDDLRAFGAAFATTSAAPMFHIVGATPEAISVEAVLDPAVDAPVITVGPVDLLASWRELNSATETKTELVALGNPHFSLDEYRQLAGLCAGRRRVSGVELIITANRDVHTRAEQAGLVDDLERFGATFVNDTCWCFTDEPVVPPSARTITTSSAKYAHYGTAAVGRGFHLRSLAGCVDAASQGDAGSALPPWLG